MVAAAVREEEEEVEEEEAEGADAEAENGTKGTVKGRPTMGLVEPEMNNEHKLQ